MANENEGNTIITVLVWSDFSCYVYMMRSANVVGNAPKNCGYLGQVNDSLIDSGKVPLDQVVMV